MIRFQIFSVVGLGVMMNKELIIAFYISLIKGLWPFILVEFFFSKNLLKGKAMLIVRYGFCLVNLRYFFLPNIAVFIHLFFKHYPNDDNIGEAILFLSLTFPQVIFIMPIVKRLSLEQLPFSKKRTNMDYTSSSKIL